jgi:hypothetical protein
MSSIPCILQSILQSFKNALAYFSTAVSKARKIFMKLAPAVVGWPNWVVPIVFVTVLGPVMTKVLKSTRS